MKAATSTDRDHRSNARPAGPATRIAGSTERRSIPEGWIRPGDFVVCAGPPLLERLGNWLEEWPHISVAVEHRGQIRLIEAGPFGCRSRLADAALRRYRQLGVGQLALTDQERARLAEYFASCLADGVVYSTSRKHLATVWTLARYLCGHPVARRLLRVAHRVVSFFAAFADPASVTCGTFVFNGLSFAGVEDRLGIRLDGPNRDAALANPGPCCRLSGLLACPHDLWASPLVTTRLLIEMDPDGTVRRRPTGGARPPSVAWGSRVQPASAFTLLRELHGGGR